MTSLGQRVDVDLGPPAGRAGHDLQAAFAQVQRLQDLQADLDLLDRRRGQRDPDGVADAPGQQRAEGHRGLDGALERRAGLGHAQVQRVVALLGQQLVGPHHDHRVVVLDRDLDVAEVVLLEQRALPQRRLDQRLRGGLAVLGQQPLVQRAGVHPDPDRRCRRPSAARAISPTLSSNALMLPGFTRTAAQPASIAANTYLGWKWMSAITGIWDFLAIDGQRLGVVVGRHGDPDDLAAGRGQLGDLLQGGVDVGGHGGGHRLHRDRGVAADADAADVRAAGSCGAGPAPARPGRRACSAGRGRSRRVEPDGAVTDMLLAAFSR